MAHIHDASIIQIKCGKKEPASKLGSGNIGVLVVINTNVKLEDYILWLVLPVAYIVE